MSETPATCEWREDDDCIWHTGCGQYWHFDDGGAPTDHKQRFCGYCGKPLTAVAYVEPKDDDE